MFLFVSNTNQTNLTLVVVVVGTYLVPVSVVAVVVVELSCVHHFRGFMDFFSSTSAVCFLFNDFLFCILQKSKLIFRSLWS